MIFPSKSRLTVLTFAKVLSDKQRFLCRLWVVGLLSWPFVFRSTSVQWVLIPAVPLLGAISKIILPLISRLFSKTTSSITTTSPTCTQWAPKEKNNTGPCSVQYADMFLAASGSGIGQVETSKMISIATLYPRAPMSTCVCIALLWKGWAIMHYSSSYSEFCQNLTLFCEWHISHTIISSFRPSQN